MSHIVHHFIDTYDVEKADVDPILGRISDCKRREIINSVGCNGIKAVFDLLKRDNINTIINQS